VSISSGDLSPLRIRRIRLLGGSGAKGGTMPPALVLVLRVPHGSNISPAITKE
jgi:hypothetical protein